MSWSTQHGDRTLNLIEIIISGEKWCSAQKLGENAADGPDIKGVGVVAGVQNDFWGSVPSGDDVFGESCGRLFVASGQTKIANFEVAILV